MKKKGFQWSRALGGLLQAGALGSGQDDNGAQGGLGRVTTLALFDALLADGRKRRAREAEHSRDEFVAGAARRERQR